MVHCAVRTHDLPEQGGLDVAHGVERDAAGRGLAGHLLVGVGAAALRGLAAAVLAGEQAAGGARRNPLGRRAMAGRRSRPAVEARGEAAVWSNRWSCTSHTHR